MLRPSYFFKKDEKIVSKLNYVALYHFIYLLAEKFMKGSQRKVCLANQLSSFGLNYADYSVIYNRRIHRGEDPSDI